MLQGGRIVILTGWLLATPFSLAQEMGQPAFIPPSVSPSGYGGVGLTPSANPTPQGMAVLGLSSALTGLTRESGYNFFGSFGLLPGFELTGRLMTADLQCNTYQPECRKSAVTRDLSVGLKLSSLLYSSASSSALFSFGVTDFGGATSGSRSAFVVGTWNRDRFSFSSGYKHPIGASAFGKGPFASLAWAASEHFQLNAEVINRDVLGSVRVWLPSRWLPEDVGVYLDAHQHFVRSREILPSTSYGIGVAVDLDPLKPSIPPPQPVEVLVKTIRGVANWLPTFERLSALPSTVFASESERVDDPTEAKALVRDASDQDWAIQVVSSLERSGFEDVSVGTMPSRASWLVRFENVDYQHNDLDAIVTAAAVVAQASGFKARPVTLRLMRRGVEAIDFSFDVSCLMPFLEQGRACATAELALQAADRSWEKAGWLARGRQRSWLVPRVYVVPALESRVGSEYGVWDASFAANLAIHVPLWRGGLIEGTQIFPVSDTHDFKKGGVFSRYRFSQRTDHRVMFHQAVGLPLGLAGRVAVGKVGDIFEGYVTELRWEPAAGRHRLGVESSKFKILEEGLSGDGYLSSELVSYRYLSARHQATFEVKAGRFFNGDEGFLVFSRLWFGDVSITPYYRQTERKERYFSERPFGYQIVPGLPKRSFAGLEFSFPLAPRKGFSSRWLRVNGNDRFFYALETMVGNPSNDLSKDYGQFPPVPLSLDGTVFNFDRASDAYLAASLGRLPAIWQRLQASDP